MKWVKRLLLPIGVVVVVVGSIVQIKLQERGDGGMVIFAPIDAPVQLTVDGRALSLPPGGFFRIEAKHGRHRVEVAGGPARDVEIKTGRDLLGVPTLPEQCFEELDVTLSHYGASAGKTPPTVARSFKFERPFQLSASEALDERELPKTTTERVNRDGKIVGMQLIFMFKTAPCSQGTKYSSSL
jgi:hypothetical protein